ncbi:MAG: HAD-IB family hydrolase [Actinomycetes bacterium]
MTTQNSKPSQLEGVSTVHLAAFDLDGTLTEGGSVFAFLVAAVGRARVLRASLRLCIGLGLAALRGGSTADRVKQELFIRTLGGLSLPEAQKIAEAYGHEHLRSHLRPKVVEALERHRVAGHQLMIVSASPAVYVQIIAKGLGIDAIAATNLEVDEAGRLTGAYEGANCRGEEKLARLQSVITELDEGQGVTLWAYGNSRGDLRMLNAAHYPVYVGKLGILSPLRKFPRLRSSPEPRDFLA